MRKKNYKGRCEKRKLPKCVDICKTYDASIGSIRIEEIESTEDYKKYVELERLGLATEEDVKLYLHKAYRVKPIMPSELPNVRIDYVSELVEGMKRHIERIPTMDKREIRNALIRMGVLDAEGKPKKQICTGDEYEE